MRASGVRVAESRIWESPAVKSKLRCRSRFTVLRRRGSRFTVLRRRFWRFVGARALGSHCTPIGVFARGIHRRSPNKLCVYIHALRAGVAMRRDNSRAINILPAKQNYPGNTKLGTRMRAKHANMKCDSIITHLFNCCLTNIATNFKHRRGAYALR